MGANQDLEHLLAGLAMADRAGVFARTHVPESSFDRPSAHPIFSLRRFATRGLSVAAVLALSVVGVRFWNGGSSSRTGIHVTGVASGRASAGGCDGLFFECVGGPRGSLSSSCRSFDFDHDGDVDLADTMTYQQGCTGLQP